jgi:DNA-binding beta-propeller fold protein YncE
MSPRRRQFLQVACTVAACGAAPWPAAAWAAQAGSLELWAGDPLQHGHGDAQGAKARFFDPRGLCADPRGGVLVADAANAMVRRIAPDGMVSSLAGVPELRKTVEGPAAKAGFVGPDALAVGADGSIYVADSYANTLRVLRDGVVSLLAGADQLPGYADGAGAQARFNHPVGIAVDPRSGDLLVADAYNHTIRRVGRDGLVSTVAGTPGINEHRDGPVRHALFNTPVGIAVQGDGSIYVSEYFNHDVRRISPHGEVSTVAGMPGKPGDVDGPGPQAQLRRPQQIAFDAAGVLYIADAGNLKLRALGTDGALRTVAGRTGGELAVPGPLPAALGAPYGVAPGPGGSIAVSSGQAVLLVRSA